jgi:hypothetical protein
MSRGDAAADPPVAPVPAGACPLCGGANACVMAAGGGADGSPCWCVAATFSDALLARVPAAARGRACICAACATGAPDRRE